MIAPSQLSGTSVSGTVCLTEAALNDLLSRTAGSRAPSVEVHPANRLVVRYGLFHAEVLLPRALELRPVPRLTLTLPSLVVALGLRAIVRLPFVHIQGREVSIYLAEIPELSAWRALLPHLDAAEFSTERGRLSVRVALEIRE